MERYLNERDQKNAPEMETNVAVMEDTPTMKRFFFMLCQKAIKPTQMGAGKPLKLCKLPGFHDSIMLKTLPLFDSMDGGELNPRPQDSKPATADSTKEFANPGSCFIPCKSNRNVFVI